MPRYLLLFDCDGTLVDSQHDIVMAMDHAFTTHGLTPPPRAATLGIVGLSIPEAIQALAPSLTDDMRHKLMTEFRLGAPAQRTGVRDHILYPGAQETILHFAREKDVVLGIATGKSRRGVQRLFDLHGWHRHFSTVQTADTNRSKPDPEMIVTAMSEVGVGPEDTIMIGDTSFDMTMARGAGVSAIGVTWGYHPEASIRDAGAQMIVRSFADLVPAISRLRS